MKAQRKKVSVIVPVYNTSEYLEKCINSIRNQTYKNIEIIIVNDGSTDQSKELIHQYEQSYPEIVTIHQSNQGLSGARNNGIKKATGEFILFVDSDDYIEQDAISKLIDVQVKEESDIVIPSKFTEITLDGEIRERLHLPLTELSNMKDIGIDILIGRGRFWRATSVLYKKNIIEKNKVSFPIGHTAEDIIFNLRYLLHAERVSFLPYSTLNVNKRDDSITATFNKDMMETFLFIDNEAQKYAKQIEYDKDESQVAIDSLLVRNLILYIRSVFSKGNREKYKDKKNRINYYLSNDRIKQALNNDQFINPYWDSKFKIKFVRIMRFLLKNNLKYGAIIVARASNLL